MFLFATCSGCAWNALECGVAPGFEKKLPLVGIKRTPPSVLLSRDPLSLETANLQACNAKHVASSYWSLCAHGCHLSGLRFRLSFFLLFGCDRKVFVIVVRSSCR